MARMNARKACLNCRQRHLKCDREMPSCRRCRISNLTCDHRVVHAFRSINFNESHSPAEHRTDNPLSPRQTRWSSDQSSQAHFVDETSSVIETHRKKARHEEQDEDFESGQRRGTLGAVSSQSFSLSPSASYFFNNPPSIIGLPLAASIHRVSSPRPFETLPSTTLNPGHSPPGSFSNSYGTQPFPVDFPLEGNTTQPPDDSIPSRPSLHTVPIISHPREAYLLKFFTQTWGPIFDCLDADLTFTKSVLHIALTSFQPLFWAILATSALQLSRVSNYPFSAAKHYRSQCSKSIMPLLSTQPETSEETLFATYVMLRNYEHMTENLMEKNTETLFTAALAISANPSDTALDRMDLGRAAFWVHLRQDIHVALLLQVPINTDYPPCLHSEKILENLDLITNQNAFVRQESMDCAWSNRIVVLLVDIINYCFQSGPRDLETWITLRGRLDHWSIAKPRKFQPYYERAAAPAEGRVFPDIWISSDCQVLAWLYYHTATILLRTYPPTGEGSSLNWKTEISPTINSLESREEVLIHGRAICGIAITNPNAQALIVICHMVTVSAIFFLEEVEQNETINLIRMAHAVTGHPLRDVEQKLRKSWGRLANDPHSNVQVE